MKCVHCIYFAHLWILVAFITVSAIVHPYDKFNGIFSPTGELHQLEYAKKSCQQGSSAICGLSVSEGKAVVAFPENAEHSLLLDSRHRLDKVTKVDDTVVLVCAGLSCDAQFLIERARRYSLSMSSSLGSSLNARSVAMHIAELFHGRTLDMRTRPFAVEAVVIGYSLSKQNLEMFAIDPSGEMNDCMGKCIGKGAKLFQQKLESVWNMRWIVKDWLMGLRDVIDGSNHVDIYRENGDGSLPTLQSGDVYEIEVVDRKLQIKRLIL